MESKRKYHYDFDHADEYEDVAPCKVCGGRPYRNIAGISCKRCGYNVSIFGKTPRQMISEWNERSE